MSRTPKVGTASNLDGLKWVDDPMALTQIQNSGASFSVETLDIDDIDLEGSIRRNNRMDRQYDKDRATDIGLQLLDTHQCLRLVARWMPADDPDNPYDEPAVDILGGNHRTGACREAGFEKVQAYMVETDDPMVITSLRNNLNNLTGIGNSRKVRLANAFTKFQNMPATDDDRKAMEELAAEHHLRTADLVTYIRAEQARTIIEAAGYQTDKLSISGLKYLKQLNDNHRLLAAAGRVANTRRLTTKQIQELVKSVKKEKGGENARLERIEAFDKSLRQQQQQATTRGGRRVAKPVYARFLEALGRLDGFLSRNEPTAPDHIQNTTKAQNIDLIDRVEYVVRSLLRLIRLKHPDKIEKRLDNLFDTVRREADDGSNSKARGKRSRAGS